MISTLFIFSNVRLGNAGGLSASAGMSSLAALKFT